MNELVSIIVPVFNVKDYLDRCVLSLVQQKLNNIEIILIDDGSDDGSEEICDNWGHKDSRIVVVHKENSGQATARNVGIEIAKGKYIGFVDSDDFVSPLMYSILLQKLEENRAQVIACGHQKFELENDISQNAFCDRVFEFSREEAIADLVKEKHFNSTVWNLLVDAKIAKQVKFDDGKINEDILWPYRVFERADKVIYIESKLYYYFQRPKSTMNSNYSKKRLDGLDALETRMLLIKGDFPQIYPTSRSVYLGMCIYHYQLIRKEKTLENKLDIEKKVYKSFCEVLNDKPENSNKVNKWHLMFKFFPKLTADIRNRFKIGY